LIFLRNGVDALHLVELAHTVGVPLPFNIHSDVVMESISVKVGPRLTLQSLGERVLFSHSESRIHGGLDVFFGATQEF